GEVWREDAELRSLKARGGGGGRGDGFKRGAGGDRRVFFVRNLCVLRALGVKIVSAASRYLCAAAHPPRRQGRRGGFNAKLAETAESSLKSSACSAFESSPRALLRS